MLDSGNPAAKAAAYDDPKVRKAFPMADLIRESINDAGPRPITPYYNDVSTSVQITWHPADGRARTADAEGDGDVHDRRPAGQSGCCELTARHQRSRP